MSIVSSIRTYLLTDSGVSTAFGSRIFVLKAPDNPNYPFAIIRTVADSPDYTHDGESSRSAVIQIDVYDDSLSDAYTNQDLIRDFLSGCSGTVGSHTVGAVFVREGQDMWMTDARHFKVFSQYVVNWTVA